MSRLATVSAALLVVLPAAGRGQESRPPTLSAEPRSGALVIELGSTLEERGLPDALQAGLPVRISIVSELWKDGFFDSQRGRAEWRASIVFDPLERRYRLETSDSTSPGDSTRVAGFEFIEEVTADIERRYDAPLRPTEDGGFYYTVMMEIETLSESDLEELRQWLGGDPAPAVEGEGELERAVGKGVRRLMVRMLGLPARRIRFPTLRFRFDPAFGVIPREPG